ncbi:transposase [Conexibacter stalactiti]|uniref:transposase n=1 Tax=Conexibacter stalactiti TaxID=1940611 RepID=UPI00384E63BE
MATPPSAELFATDACFARHAGVAPVPASSGPRERHRLDRGGDRQLNRAPRHRHHPRPPGPRHKRLPRPQTSRKQDPHRALRCLKRLLARRYPAILSRPRLT